MRTILVFLALLFSISGQAQFDLQAYNAERQQLERSQMLTLGGWAVGNLVVGGIGMASSEGSTKYFHQMNLGWGAINLSIAGLAYWGVQRNARKTLNYRESFAAQRRIENSLLFNAGLDLGYMAGGLYLLERAKTAGDNADRFRGFGQSIILQGAFLFSYDLLFFIFHNNHNKKLMRSLDNAQLSFTGNGFSLRYTF